MQPIRVLFLTQYFPPETGAPPARLYETARCLAERGFEVEVLTAIPNYPCGEVYPEYKGKLWATEEKDGLRILRAPIYPTKSPALLPRLTNYFSFVLSSMLFGLLLPRRPHVIVTESPPLFLGLAGIFLKLTRRSRLVFNVSDLWPESAVRMGLHDSKPLVWLAGKLEKLCYHSSSAMTGQSLGIVRGVKEKHPRGMVELVPNGCDCRMFQPSQRDGEFRRRHGLEGKVVVGYAGLIGLAQGTSLLVDLAEHFRNDQRIHFVIAGDGPERERLERSLQEKGLTNVLYAGLLKREQMPGIVAAFDIALVPLRYQIPGALPSKVYEAMASQVPIVLAATGDPRDLVETAQAGIVVDYGCTDTIIGAIEKLVGDPSLRRRLGTNGRQYVLRHHQRHQIAEKMGQVLQAVAA